MVCYVQNTRIQNEQIRQYGDSIRSWEDAVLSIRQQAIELLATEELQAKSYVYQLLCRAMGLRPRQLR